MPVGLLRQDDCLMTLQHLFSGSGYTSQALSALAQPWLPGLLMLLCCLNSSLGTGLGTVGTVYFLES